jgi:transposase
MPGAKRANKAARRLLQVPGIGLITTTALSATVIDPMSFKSAREFAAWIGLVPRQHSSGGHERLGRIIKMGPAYLRRLWSAGRRLCCCRLHVILQLPAMSRPAAAREAAQGRGRSAG